MKSRRAECLPVLGLILLYSVVVTWPLVLHPSTFVMDEGDPLFTSWLLRWVNQTFWSSPGSMFDPPVFYPETGVLAFSETLLLPSIMVSPILLLGGSGILANNLLFLLSFLLAGWFLYLMCRELGLSPAASTLGAFLFDFAPYRMDFSHVQLSQIQYLPLQVLLVNRYFRSRKLRYLIGAWLALAATALSCSYYGVYALLLMVLLHLFYLIGNLKSFDRGLLVSILTAPLPAAAVLTPYYLKYAEVRQLYSFGRTLDDLLPFGADLYSYARYFYHSAFLAKIGRSTGAGGIWYLTPGLICILLAGAMLVLRPIAPGGERIRFAGVLKLIRSLAVASALAAFAAGATGLIPHGATLANLIWIALLLWAIEIGWTLYNSGGRVGPPVFAWIAVLSFVLSFGLEIHVAGNSLGPGIYGFFHSYFPGFWGIRAVYRASVLFFLCFATLSAYGLDRLRERGWLPRAGPLILTGLAAVEFLNAPIPWVRYSTRDAAAYEWLRSKPDGRAVLELPLGTFLGPYRAMYESLNHGHPILNGVSGFIPQSYYERTRTLESYPSHASQDLLFGFLPLKYILWRQEPANTVEGNAYASLGSLPFIREVARFGSATIFEVRHDSPGERELQSLPMFVDPRRIDGKEITLTVEPAVDDGIGRTVEARIGDRIIASASLDRRRRLTIKMEDIDARGAVIQLSTVETGKRPWELQSWETTSSVTKGMASITIEGMTTTAPAMDGILIASTDSRSETPSVRMIEHAEDKKTWTRARGTLKRLRSKRYLFIAFAGSALSDAPEPFKAWLGRFSGIEPRSGAFVCALRRSPSGRLVDISAEAGDSEAKLADGRHGFLIRSMDVR